MFSIFLTILLAFPLFTRCEKSKKINTTAFVDYINNLDDCTWKADDYGTKEIDVSEFRRERLGLKMSKKKKSAQEKNAVGNQMPYRREDEFPKSFSYVANNLNHSGVETRDTFDCPIGNIRYQSNCGSCWAVSTAAAFSDRLCLWSNGTFKTPLSADHLTACNRRNFGCYGGYMERVLEYLRKNGTTTGGEYDSEEGCQPYSVRPCGMYTKLPCSSRIHLDPKCKEKKCSNPEYPHKEEKRWYNIDSWWPIYTFSSNADAMEEIYNDGPIIAAFTVYEDFILYKKGIYEHKKGYYLGGHAVRVVGWGTENGVSYWHAANSWGSDWGENGFFRIRMSSLYNCGFEEDMYSLSPNMTDIV